MTNDSAQLQAKARVCDACGAVIGADRPTTLADGRQLCVKCDEDQEPLVVLEIDRDVPPDAVTCQCSVCMQPFPVDEMYESNRQMICKGCVGRARDTSPETSNPYRLNSLHAGASAAPPGIPIALEESGGSSAPAPIHPALEESGGSSAPAPVHPALEESGAARSLPRREGISQDDDALTKAATTKSAAEITPDALPSTAPAPKPQLPARAALLMRVTCPHCWHRFEPQEILWVAKHPELIGDLVAGDAALLRFLPSHFNAAGFARDPRGMICDTLACPNCHLIIPRALLEAEPLFASIAGAPASGKTHFLAAMIWELRRLLPLHFGVSFTDADPGANVVLNRDEETLFLPADPEQFARLEKTVISGNSLYDEVRIDQQAVTLPKPLLLTMRPGSRHPNAEAAAQLTRVLCLYDHAGEHFNPGQGAGNIRLTQHLGSSRVLMFLYDPMQDPRVRARCLDLSNDPQLTERASTRRQETVLLEMLARVRQFAGLPATQPIDRPLLVVLPKADAWGKLASLDLLTEPIIPNAVAGGALAGVDLDRIEGVSIILRELLSDVAPEFVACVEESCAKVVYIPVSALGNSPEIVEGRDGLWIRPSQVKPRWVTVPFLYMFARWSHDVIGGVRNMAT